MFSRCLLTVRGWEVGSPGVTEPGDQQSPDRRGEPCDRASAGEHDQRFAAVGGVPGERAVCLPQPSELMGAGPAETEIRVQKIEHQSVVLGESPAGSTDRQADRRPSGTGGVAGDLVGDPKRPVQLLVEVQAAELARGGVIRDRAGGMDAGGRGPRSRDAGTRHERQGVDQLGERGQIRASERPDRVCSNGCRERYGEYRIDRGSSPRYRAPAC
jgi:hypothetical protein